MVWIIENQTMISLNRNEFLRSILQQTKQGARPFYAYRETS
jgi:hypothetical protein